MKTASLDKASAPAALPWWRSAMVWMVIAGPLSVVIASVATAVVAWRHIDPVVATPGRFGPDDDVSATRDPKDPLAPAQKARNHAATPAR
ncbi:MAG: hypothetical protein KF788_19100 [Piscinibacter sp.]|nr:hypothetical protein [Piscinibacter sp.]